MTFVEAIQSGFRNYVKFEGRASRSEFWWWILFYVIVSVVVAVIGNMLGTNAGLGLRGLVGLIFFLPTLGLEVRRLHDTGRSGWWVLIAFVPIVGIILLIVWWASRGTEGPNKYGIGATATQIASKFE